MKKLLLAALLSLLPFCATDAQTGLPGVPGCIAGSISGVGVPNGCAPGVPSSSGGSVAIPLSLDGSVGATNGGTATAAVTLSTTKTNDLIVVCVVEAGGPATGVSGSSLGAFTLRARIGTGLANLEEWTKVAASALTNETITVTQTAAGSATAVAFGVNGAHTAAPFDTNASLPKTSAVLPSDPITVSTTAASTMAIGCFKENTVASPTAGSGWTQIYGAGFTQAEYQIFSSAQTNLSITQTTGNGDSNGSIGDAIIQGP